MLAHARDAMKSGSEAAAAALLWTATAAMCTLYSNDNAHERTYQRRKWNEKTDKKRRTVCMEHQPSAAAASNRVNKSGGSEQQRHRQRNGSLGIRQYQQWLSFYYCLVHRTQRTCVNFVCECGNYGFGLFIYRITSNVNSEHVQTEQIFNIQKGKVLQRTIGYRFVEKNPLAFWKISIFLIKKLEKKQIRVWVICQKFHHLHNHCDRNRNWNWALDYYVWVCEWFMLTNNSTWIKRKTNQLMWIISFENANFLD